MYRKGQVLQLSIGEVTIVEKVFDKDGNVCYMIEFSATRKISRYRQSTINRLCKAPKIDEKKESYEKLKKDLYKRLESPQLTESEFQEITHELAKIERKKKFQECLVLVANGEDVI